MSDMVDDLPGLERVPPMPGIGQRAGARVGAADGFALLVAPPPPAPSPAATPAPSMVGLLAMQEEVSGKVQDLAARRQAARVLRNLRDLQLALLSAGADPQRLADASPLADLAAGAGSLPDCADPELRAVLDAIRLRARVALALQEAAARDAVLSCDGTGAPRPAPL
jgi:hypothetical protein